VKIWADLQNTQGDVLTVEAIGYQFGFQYRYPKLTAPTTELHLPVNTPVTIHVTSRDVIHGFWLPELRQKADMVPGLVNTIRVKPTRVGQYRVVCSEFCGIAHGAMKGVLFVDSQADFQKWFAAQGGGSAGAAAAGAAGGAAVAVSAGQADAGQKLFAAKCSACHSTGGFDQKVVGPGLGKVFSDPAHPKLVNGAAPTPDNVAKIIHDGYQGDLGVMPSAQVNGLSNTDIANLTAYLVSLSKK
jgi:cytochrome c oxidase subunit 2